MSQNNQTISYKLLEQPIFIIDGTDKPTSPSITIGYSNPLYNQIYDSYNSHYLTPELDGIFTGHISLPIDISLEEYLNTIYISTAKKKIIRDKIIISSNKNYFVNGNQYHIAFVYTKTKTGIQREIYQFRNDYITARKVFIFINNNY